MFMCLSDTGDPARIRWRVPGPTTVYMYRGKTSPTTFPHKYFILLLNLKKKGFTALSSGQAKKVLKLLLTYTISIFHIWFLFHSLLCDYVAVDCLGNFLLIFEYWTEESHFVYAEPAGYNVHVYSTYSMNFGKKVKKHVINICA